MAADLRHRRMAYLCSKQGDQGPQLVSPGLHGVTNGVLEAHWPKASAVCRFGVRWFKARRGLLLLLGWGRHAGRGVTKGSKSALRRWRLGCERACRVWPGTGLA